MRVLVRSSSLVLFGLRAVRAVCYAFRRPSCSLEGWSTMTALLRRLARFARRLTGLKSQHLKIPYAWIPYHLYDDGSAWAPLTVTMELTYLCNLRCKMCSLVEGGMVTKKGQR